MSDIEKVLELIQNNGGYITTKEVVKNNLNKMTLKRLCDSELIERISPGYYSIPNMFIDDYYKVISKSKDAIFSYNTALFLNDLSDRTPIYFDITVPKGYGGILQKLKQVSLHYVNRSILNIGLKTIKSPFGMNIKCYDIERTICDIIKNKKQMDKEIYSKALKLYANRKDKDLSKLSKYSKELNIEEEVSEIMQVIL